MLNILISIFTINATIKIVIKHAVERTNNTFAIIFKYIPALVNTSFSFGIFIKETINSKMAMIKITTQLLIRIKSLLNALKSIVVNQKIQNTATAIILFTLILPLSPPIKKLVGRDPRAKIVSSAAKPIKYHNHTCYNIELTFLPI